MPSLTPVTVGGVQIIYDSDAVDVTADAAPGATGVYWLADANFAASKEGRALAAQYGVTGINPDGSMTYGTALHWVDALNQAKYAGHCNWSLPGTLPNDAGLITNDPNVLTGPPDNELHNRDSFGYDCAASPMGHLFYSEFGGVLGDTLSTLHNQANVKLFKNFQPYYYWSGTEEPSRSLPADFSFGSGFLGTDKNIDFEYVIPEFSSDPTDITGKLLQDFPVVDNIVVTPPPVSVPSGPLTVNPDGTIHDATLNINWLADTNFAATHTFGISHVRLDPIAHPGLDLSSININPDGTMNHETAVAWIAAMNQADYLGHNNWRLPDSQDLAPQNYYRTNAEMGELFYSELGGQAGSTIGLLHNSAFKLFKNFQPYYYWSGSPTNGDASGDTDGRESFSFGTGYRSDNTHFNFMYVIPVYDSPRIVKNNLDAGPNELVLPGSLRQVIDSSHGGDTILFSPSLAGQTITLRSPIYINQDNEFENKVLNIVGLGSGRLAISGNNVTQIFNIGPSLRRFAVAGPTATTISGLTLENGLSGAGGAIFDDGMSLTLVADIFESNQAIGKPGQDALGGAVAVVNDATPSMSVLITACQFSNNSAVGGAGKVGISGAQTNGGDAKGGALYVDAGSSSGLFLSVIGSCFTHDSAIGGNGANADDSAGTVAADGGNGLGGAVYLATDSAGVSLLAFFDLSAFTDCSAIGGATGNTSDGYPGGQNGAGYGGAIYIGAGASVYDFLIFFDVNHADFGRDHYGIFLPI